MVHARPIATGHGSHDELFGITLSPHARVDPFRPVSPQREEQPKKKKKRKGEDSPNSADEKEKRTKTGRACDACVSSHHNLLLMAADEKDTVRHSTLRPAYLRTLQAVQSGVYILYAHHRDAVQKEATGR
jgi:hypothetical protein